MRKFKISGQQLVELALCLATVSAVILAMRLYVVRGLQARYKDGPRYFFSQIEQEKGAPVKTQYDPYYKESYSSEKHNSKTKVGYPESSIERTVKEYGWQTTSAPRNGD